MCVCVCVFKCMCVRVCIYILISYLLSIFSGFELTVPWLTEEGLPQKGIFNVYYFGIDHGKKKTNFQAAVKLRKSMLYLVRT